MSKARYKSYLAMSSGDMSAVTDYVKELEQQIKELKESQKQKQIIRLCNRLNEAEQQKAELIECLKDFTEDRLDISIYYDKCNELLNKYKGG